MLALGCKVGLISKMIKSTVLPKYQPKRGGDLGWGKFFRLNAELKTIIKLLILIKRIQEHNSIATQIWKAIKHKYVNN